MATIYISRVVGFSAAHKLYLDEHSYEDNVKWFGKCAHPNGHGHNYTLEVTLKGVVDSKLGMVEHLDKVKQILDEKVHTPLDHRNLNIDVPWLSGVNPTLENIVVGLWQELLPALKSSTYQLFKLKLSSSAKNWVEYWGE